MSLSQAAYKIEKANGHGGAITEQDVANPANNPDRFGEPNETMLAVTWEGKNSVKVSSVPKPKIVENRDVIVKVTGSTICGSDLHLYHGSVLQMAKGDILGHEFCGIVESTGPSVSSPKVGDRVVASFQIACGDCYYCKKKQSSQCEMTNANTMQKKLLGGRTSGTFGYSHLTGGFAGGQAEYVRVPFGDVNLLKIPNDVPDEKALYLSDVLCTSWHCVVDTRVDKGDVVAIWGAGPIGQMCAAFAFHQGASRVIMIDNNWRLTFVRSRLSNVELLDYSTLPRGTSVMDRLKELVDGRGPDVALDCAAGEYPKSLLHRAEIAIGAETDTSETLNEMITSVKSFGRCGVTGVYVGYTNHFNIGALMERGVRLIGNGQAPVHMYWEELLKMIQSGEIEPLDMVSHRVSLEDMVMVYEKFDKREDGLQKVYVQTRFSHPPTKGSPSLTTYSTSI